MTEYKDRRITVQVSEKEKRDLSILARREGLTIGAYIRKVAIYDKWNKLFEEDK